MCVGGLVQIIAQAVLEIFGQKFQALPGGHNLRVEFFQILFQGSGLSAKVIQLPLRAGSCRGLSFEERGERSVAITCAGGRVVVLGFDACQLRTQQSRLLQQTLVGVAGLRKLLGAVPGQDVVADEIEKERVERLEAVRIVHEIAEQNVMLEEELIVVAAFDEQETVLQKRISLRNVLAEKSAPRLRDRAFLDFAPDAAQRLADLADHVLAVRLHLGDLRAHHVRLLAVLE